MEFFAKADVPASAAMLQQRLDIRSLPAYCASVMEVYDDRGDAGEIYCVWGRFVIHRELLHEGVRFTLPTCINAVQWTLTCAAPAGGVDIHLTINRQSHDEDFIESLEEFVNDWKSGLEAAWSGVTGS